MKHFPMVHNPLKQACGSVLSMLLLMLFAVLSQAAWAVDVSSLPEHDDAITFTAITGTDGYENENYDNLFDGKTDTKYCLKATDEMQVIFRASKAGSLVGYTITTGNDNIYFTHRNPRSWKIYGSMSADGEWTLLETIDDDDVMRDLNSTAYTYATPNANTGKYEYFKWVITANQGAVSMQVAELKLYLQPCSHKNADGTSALGEKTGSYEATCMDYAHDLYHCSVCDHDVRVYTGTAYGAHVISHVDAAEPTCTVDGHNAYYTCTVCHKYFSDAEGTQQIASNSVLIAAKGHHFVNGTCTNDGCNEADSRYPAISVDGVTVITDDPSSYAWKYDSENKTIHSTNAGFKNTTSSYSLKLQSDKDFLLSFDYGASSEFYNDLTTLTIDGSVFSIYSGDYHGNDFNNSFSYVFTAGEHTINFAYAKDNSNDKGKDMAYVSNIKVTTNTSDAKVTELLYAVNSEDNSRTTKLAYGTLKLPCFDVVNSCKATTALIVEPLIIDESVKNFKPTSMYRFFAKFNPTTITGMEYLNTSEVTDFSYMFSSCTRLTTIDLSHLNTEKATSFYAMFYNCNKLESIDLSQFNTANATNMYAMFTNCQLLKSIAFPSTFNTEKVEDMMRMFYGCQALESLDLSTFSTPNLQTIGEMFRGCINMTSLKFSPAFVTDKVTSMRGVFYGCEKLESVDLSSFHTDNVSYFTQMFYWCKALTTLDLTSFSMKIKPTASEMFKDCSALTTIYVSDKFKIGSTANNMFANATNLVGAVSYDESKTNGDMANYNTGYFKTYYQNGTEKHELFGKDLKVDNLTLSDDADLKVNAPFTATTVSYNRTVKANAEAAVRWGSICLPYAITAPVGCKLYTLRRIETDDNTNEGTIIVTEQDKLEAGTPAFFCVEDANTTSVDFGTTDAAITNSIVDNSKTPVEGGLYLQGTYATQALDMGYVLMNNAMWSADAVKNQTGKTVNAKAFRAYLALASNAAAPSAQKLNFGPKDATGIQTVINDLNEADAAIYDASGRRQSSLQHGLNIIRKANGKSVKVMVK